MSTPSEFALQKTKSNDMIAPPTYDYTEQDNASQQRILQQKEYQIQLQQ